MPPVSIAASFGRSGFARFINSTTGRGARMALGVGLIAWGYAQRGSTTGLVLMVLALVPLATGGLDWCVISAALGGPLSGVRIRKGTLDS